MLALDINALLAEMTEGLRADVLRLAPLVAECLCGEVDDG